MEHEKRKYSHHCVWSDEDQEYVVTSPEFPGLSGLSETPEEALAVLQEAIDIVVQSRLEHGEALPDPVTLQGFSGQLRVRLGKSLHAAATARAEQESLSLNAFIQSAVAAAVKAADVYAGAAAEFRAATREMRELMSHALMLERAAQMRALQAETQSVWAGRQPQLGTMALSPFSANNNLALKS